MYEWQIAKEIFAYIAISFVLVGASPMKYMKGKLIEKMKGKIPPVLHSWLFEANTCLYCTTFWVALFGAALMGHGFFAPVVACMASFTAFIARGILRKCQIW